MIFENLGRGKLPGCPPHPLVAELCKALADVKFMGVVVEEVLKLLQSRPVWR